MGKCENIAATLRKRVTIQSVSRASDGQGGYTESWDDVATVWASIEPVKAYERFQASQMQAPISHKIVMRYRSDMNSAGRLIYGERIFWVKEAINIEERGRFLNIKAIEREGSVFLRNWETLGTTWENIGSNWDAIG